MKHPDHFLNFFDTEVRQQKGKLASTYRRETLKKVRRVIGPTPHPAHNWIEFSDLADDEVEDAVAAQIEAYRSIGHSFRWKWCDHDQPVRLRECLAKNCHEVWEPSALLVLDVREYAPRYPAEIDFCVLENPDVLPDELRPIWDQVWQEGADDFIKALVEEMRDMGEHFQLTVAKRDGKTIGCGLIRYSARMTFGGLFAGATIPTERRRGVYRGIISARVEQARAAGANYLYTEAGPMSLPILEQLGFQRISTITNYVFQKAN